LTAEQQNKRLDLLKCKPVGNGVFKNTDYVFHYLIKLKNPFPKYYIETFVTNLMGLTLLKLKRRKMKKIGIIYLYLEILNCFQVHLDW